MEPNQEHSQPGREPRREQPRTEPEPTAEQAQRLETTRDFLEIAYRQRQAIREAVAAVEKRRSEEPLRAESTLDLAQEDVAAVRSGMELDARDAGISRQILEAAHQADESVAALAEQAEATPDKDAEATFQAEIDEFAKLAAEIGVERTTEELVSMATQSRAMLNGEIAVVRRDFETKKAEAGARFAQRNLGEFQEEALARRAHLYREAVRERDLRNELAAVADQCTDAELAAADIAVKAVPLKQVVEQFQKRKAEAQRAMAAGETDKARQLAAEVAFLEDRLEEVENQRERAFVAEASRLTSEMNRVLEQSPEVDQERLAKRKREEAVMGNSANEIGSTSLGGGVNETTVTTYNAAPPAGAEMRGITKPHSGEVRGYRTGIERGTMYRREWLAYMVDKAFDLGVVPTTVVGEQRRRRADGTEVTQFSSTQKFEKGRTAKEISTAGEDWGDMAEALSLLKVAILDYLILSTDRHGGNFLLNDDGELIAIDNGFCASAADKVEQIQSQPLNQVRFEGAGRRGPQFPPELTQVFTRFGGARAELLRQAFVVALGDEEGNQVFNGMMDRVKPLRHGRIPG
jgi:hypothetical protein